MAAELFHPTLTQLQDLAHNHDLNPNVLTEPDPSWMWRNSKHRMHGLVEVINEDDSWEVRAFAQDTNNAMGTTWPPRSYTCNFCRREFRSAQALGGHMNVHRRDRARLHQNQNQNNNNYSTTIINTTSSPYTTLKTPPQEYVTNGGGLCFLYELPNTNNVTALTPKLMSNSPSTLLSISPYLPTNTVSPPAFPPPLIIYNLPQRSGILLDEETTSSGGGDSVTEELDLELRLGH